MLKMLSNSVENTPNAFKSVFNTRGFLIHGTSNRIISYYCPVPWLNKSTEAICG